MKLDTVALIEMLAIEEARESFWAYRQYIDPKMKLGWWQREMAGELQQFYHDLMAGKRPKLAIQAPPQHGKSKMVADFITWVAGKSPDQKAIYASFSERLGVRANLMCQRVYDSDKYKRVFPNTQINSKGMDSTNINGAIRNREMVEYIGHSGFFRNTTVRGSITGESLDFGIVDDPVKGRKEAGSEAVRNETWEWFTDDFFTRFSDDAGFLVIMTRWHTDDLIGRLKNHMGSEVRIVSYPAVAEKDEPNRKVGEALFPEHKPLEFLLERKTTMATPNWEALYQQNPQIVGGNILRGSWFGRYKIPPQFKYRIIYADTAQKTKESNDYSVLECWGLGEDNKVYLLDLLRGKWEAPDLKRKSIDFWNKHKALDSRLGALRKMRVEDKASGTGLIQEIRRDGKFPIDGIQRGVDKYTRLLDVQGYIESGYVIIPEDAPWVQDFVDECEAFTADDSHKHDDQIDPMIDAINDMLGLKKKRLIMEWD